MPAKGQVELVVTFGPTSSPALGTALAWARTYASEVSELQGGAVRATFVLETEHRGFGAAEQLLFMVGGWKTTTIEVDHSPESRWTVLQMLLCSRGWLRSEGRCKERLARPGGEPKCHSCPLYDPEWAAESGPGFVPLVFPPEEPVWPDVPDYPPEDWMGP